MLKCRFDLIWFIVFNATFSYSMATSCSGGRSRSTRREPPTMGKQLVNFITCDCESSAPFFVIYTAGREPTPYSYCRFSPKKYTTQHWKSRQHGLIWENEKIVELDVGWLFPWSPWHVEWYNSFQKASNEMNWYLHIPYSNEMGVWDH